LEYLELNYVDHKYTDPASWGADRATFAATNPLANIPYLKDGETIIFESQAIPVYLINKAGRHDLFGSNQAEQVAVAQARGVIEDLFGGFMKIFFGNKEDFSTKGKE
jgi:glutathione S-transferase